MQDQSDNHLDATYDYIVAGAGLAGMLCTYELSKNNRVLLLDPRGVAGGTSGMASGLVNPMMSQKANPVWNWELCLAALESNIAESKLEKHYTNTGILRPAKSQDQADFFHANAVKHSEIAHWLNHESSEKDFPHVRAPFGSLLVRRGGSINIVNWLNDLGSLAESRGARFQKSELESWKKSESGFECLLDNGEIRAGKKLLLCTGRWSGLLGPEIESTLHSIKGQSLEIERPDKWPGSIAISGASYVITHEKRLTIGSTYEHSFKDLEVDPSSSSALLKRAGVVNSDLENGIVLDEWVGVRISKPGSRLPYFAEIEKDVFSCGALGSKGILLGSFISQNLERWIEDPETVPSELRWS